jgi:hypothetical protein
MVLRNDLLGAENGIMRWDVEEIVYSNSVERRV